MRKILRIIAVASGIFSAVSLAVLACIYTEDIINCFKKIKTNNSNIIDA